MSKSEGVTSSASQWSGGAAPAGALRVCTRCIMDTTDPDITFDEAGVCNHCAHYDEMAGRLMRTGEAGERELADLVRRIREEGAGKRYDCVVGVSGGVDSTYVAYQAKRLGLRPLAVHVDNGWNSELAVQNIEHVLKKLEIDLYTEVLDWEEFRDLQLSFLRASVPDAEIPTDHAIGAVVYRIAAQNGIRYILSGSNVATEGILPSAWTYGISDWKYIRSIQKIFGTRKLKRFPHYSLPRWMGYVGVNRLTSVRILDYLPYNKKEVIGVLERDLGWRYYGGKHYESIYTRFFQGYILPRKFGYDKRKAHLSTLICAGQITREAALGEIEKPPYPEELQRQDLEYSLKKFEISGDEFERIMNLPPRTHEDYPTNEALLGRIRAGLRIGRRMGLVPAHLGASL